MKICKKTAVVDAFQLPEADNGDTKPFIKWAKQVNFTNWKFECDRSLKIETLAGAISANPCDWIIKDATRGFYACKPDVFIATYDCVEAAAMNVQQAADRNDINRPVILPSAKNTPLTREENALLESIASRHTNLRDPAAFARSRWGSAERGNVLAALQELQAIWKLNVAESARTARTAALEEAKATVDLQWLSEQNKQLIKRSIDRLKPPSEVPKPQPNMDEVGSYKRMFKAAAYALGLINEALGIDADDAGGAGPILAAIVELKASQPVPIRDIPATHDSRSRE